ncbi:hypothetical protein ACJD0Z_16910 [Flavobacteriaceae bacterium M23B6Z8]
MNDIQLLFHNDFGMAFHWKNKDTVNTNQVQLVFRDTGLLLKHPQLLQLKAQINKTIETCTLCSACKANKDCRVILLETPVSELSFALSYHELHLISELLAGALFQVEMNTVLAKQHIYT